jgi:GTP-binding protein
VTPKTDAQNPGFAIVDAAFVRGVASTDQLPPPALAEIAFAGRSNVGKSSLLNALLGRKGLVRTGRAPGTTRQLNVFSARAADGLELLLVDLPGYGFAKRGKQEKATWGPLIEGYLSKRVSLRAVVLLVDVRRGAEREEQELLEYMASARADRRPPEVIAVATKIDKLAGAAQKPAIQRIGRTLGLRAHGFSAHTGQGRDDLWRAIRKAIAGAPSDTTAGAPSNTTEGGAEPR